MPRPRTISDADILAAAARAIGDVGPARLTLAHVARAAGVSPATLLQRFGSKRGLLLHLAEGAVASARAALAGARATHLAPLDRIRHLLAAFADLADTPEEMAHHLAFLQMDLTDPDFHRLARAHALEQQRQLQGLLVEAEGSGELQAGDAAARARLLLAVTNGSLLRWAIVRKGTAHAWLAADIEAILALWRTSAAPRRPSRNRSS